MSHRLNLETFFLIEPDFVVENEAKTIGFPIMKTKIKRSLSLILVFFQGHQKNFDGRGKIQNKTVF